MACGVFVAGVTLVATVCGTGAADLGQCLCVLAKRCGLLRKAWEKHMLMQEPRRVHVRSCPCPLAGVQRHGTTVHGSSTPVWL